jgi:hypothetical protein
LKLFQAVFGESEGWTKFFDGHRFSKIRE